MAEDRGPEEAATADAVPDNLAPPSTVPLRHHLALCVYWLSNTLLWGALLHLALQSRLSDWFGETTAGYYLALLGGVGAIIATATQLIAGAFSDRSTARLGRRRPYIAAGSLLCAGALLLLGASSSFWPFFLGFILVEFFSNFALGPYSALLPDTVPTREHGKTSGFMGVARLMGDAGGMVLAAALLEVGTRAEYSDPAAYLSLRRGRMLLLCVVMGGFMLLTMVITVLTIKERAQKTRPDATIWEIVGRSFQVDLRAHRDFLWLSVSRAVTNLGIYSFLVTLEYFCRYTLHAPKPDQATMTLMIPAIVAAAVGSVASGIVSDRIGRKPVLYLSQFLMAAGGLGYALTPSLGIGLALAIPMGFGYGIFTAVEWAMACTFVPKNEAAKYLGFWNVSAVVPQVCAFGLGAVGSGIGGRFPGVGWRVIYLLSMVSALVGAWFLRYVREPVREEDGRPAPTR